MALPSSGTISLNDIKSEFGATGTRDITDFYRGGLYVPNIPVNSGVPMSGTIALTDFYGASDGPTGSPPSAPSGHYVLAQKFGGVSGGFNDNSSDETSFRLERQIDGGVWSFVEDLSANDNNYTDNPFAAEGYSLRYRVRAQNLHGNSGWAYSNIIDPYGGGLGGPGGGGFE